MNAQEEPAGRLAVEVVGLRKVFRDFWLRARVTAVDGLDLEVRTGEVFGLLGPNGSGKSTTIKVLLGLLFPTAGRVSILGRPPSDVRVKARIGYLPEESFLYPFLTGRETLEYYGRLLRVPRPLLDRRSSGLLRLVGLEGAQGRPVGEYSKGMQRRIGLAQALLNDPELLILDEPTSGLDPIGTRQIKDLVRWLREHGRTVLLSSHLLADVEEICDRVAILYGGRVQATGTVRDLLTDRESTLIEAESLPAEAIPRLRETVEGAGGKVLHIGAPRRSLESLFLSIVASAREGGMRTSGAESAAGPGEGTPRDGNMRLATGILEELFGAGGDSSRTAV